MRFLALTVLALCTSLWAVELEELKRSEDWETYLGQAGDLARAHKFDAAAALYAKLADAAGKFSFPLTLLAKCRNNHAAMLHASGRYFEAEKLYREAATLWTRSVGAESDQLATTLNNLGEVYRLTGRYLEAEKAYRDSLAIRDAIGQQNQLRTAAALNNLGTVQLQAFRNGAAPTAADAEANYQRALQIKRAAYGPAHPEVAVSINNLAALRQDTGDPAGAEKLYREALAIRQAQQPPDPPSLASVHNNLGTLLRREGRPEEAETHLVRANTLWEQSLGPAHPTLAAGLNNCAELFLSTGRSAEAEPLFRRAIAIQEAAAGPDHLQTVAMVENLAALFLQQGKVQGAESLFRRVLAARTTQLGPANPLTLDAMHNIAQTLTVQGRYTESERLLTAGLTIIEGGPLRQSSQHVAALLELAQIHYAQHRLETGAAFLDQVDSLTAPLTGNQKQQLANLRQNYARQNRGSKPGPIKSLLPR